MAILVHEFDDLACQVEERHPDAVGDVVVDDEFWHFLTDVYEDTFGNGAVIAVNWAGLIDQAESDAVRAKLKAFVAEFGDQDMQVRFSW